MRTFDEVLRADPTLEQRLGRNTAGLAEQALRAVALAGFGSGVPVLTFDLAQVERIQELYGDMAVTFALIAERMKEL